jgi:hypothetical protein
MKPHASKETIQRLIVGKALEGLLSGSSVFGVETGDQEPLLGPSDEIGEIMAAIFASDSDEVWLFGPGRMRWVKFVLGNGVDVISDYHVGLEGALAKANALASALEG